MAQQSSSSGGASGSGGRPSSGLEGTMFAAAEQPNDAMPTARIPKTSDRLKRTEIGDSTFVHLKRYTINKSVGSGAQGVVVSARDAQENRDVAIKKLARPFMNQTHAKRAFREFVLMRKFCHVNIISLLNAFTPSKTIDDFQEVYLVMEKMDANLCQVISMRLDHERLSFLLYQLFCGTKYLHEAGIIHRDLKPSNIVVKSDCSLKILDFGLARDADMANSKLTPYVVTRYYRAPEVILGMHYTEAVDIWSIGCIFGELVRQKVLFPGRDHVDQWHQIAAVMGMPDETFRRRLTSPVRNYVESKTPRATPTTPLSSLVRERDFPANSRENTSLCVANGRDLLHRMLVLDPQQRITVLDAIEHPYIKLWKQDAEVNVKPPENIYDPKIETQDLSVNQWRRLLWKELIEFEAEKNLTLFEGDAAAASGGSSSGGGGAGGGGSDAMVT